MSGTFERDKRDKRDKSVSQTTKKTGTNGTNVYKYIVLSRSDVLSR